MAFGKLGESWSIFNVEDRLGICTTIPLLQDPEMTILPLGQTVFGYTFAYLLISIVKHKMVLQNWPTLLFFPCLIISDIVWNISYGCNTLWALAASLVLGSLIGALWGYIIMGTNSTYLQYYTGVPNNETCSVPSKQTFKCNVYKNGKLITNTNVKS
jgi:hypothetical protein